jgi:hypothetical protein
MNYVAAASEQAQPNATEPEMIADVKIRCAQLPSQALASAVWATYLNFSGR